MSKIVVRGVELRDDPVRWPAGPPRLDGLDDGLNVVYGGNGTGKSSLRRAIQKILWNDAVPDDGAYGLRFEVDAVPRHASPIGRRPDGVTLPDVRPYLLDLASLLDASSAKGQEFREHLGGSIGTVPTPREPEPRTLLDGKRLDDPARARREAIAAGERSVGLRDELAALERRRADLPSNVLLSERAKALDDLADAREKLREATSAFDPEAPEGGYDPADAATLAGLRKRLADAVADRDRALADKRSADAAFRETGGEDPSGRFAPEPGLVEAIDDWTARDEDRHRAATDLSAARIERDALARRLGMDAVEAPTDAEAAVRKALAAEAKRAGVAEAAARRPLVAVPDPPEERPRLDPPVDVPEARPTRPPFDGPGGVPGLAWAGLGVAALGTVGGFAHVAGLGVAVLGLALAAVALARYRPGRSDVADAYADALDGWILRDAERRATVAADRERAIEANLRADLGRAALLDERERLGKIAAALDEQGRRDAADLEAAEREIADARDALRASATRLGLSEPALAHLDDLLKRQDELRRADRDVARARGLAEAAEESARDAAATVRALAERCGLALAPDDRPVAARRRLESAIARDRAATKLRSARDEAARHAARVAEIDGERAALLAARGATGDEEFLRLAGRVAEWREADARLREADRRLAGLLAAVPEDRRDDGAPELRAEAARLRDEADRVRDEGETLSREIGRREKEIETICADGAQERADGAYRQALVEWAAERDRHLVARASIRVAEELNRILLETNQPPAAERANRWLGRVADGPRIVAGTTGFDVTLDGREFSFDRLSDGTRTQILIAARLGVLDAAETEHRGPVLVDEALAMSDITRSEMAMQVFLDVARERQVIVFTNQWDEVLRWNSQAEQRNVELTRHLLSEPPPDAPLAPAENPDFARPLRPYSPDADPLAVDVRLLAFDEIEEAHADRAVRDDFVTVRGVLGRGDRYGGFARVARDRALALGYAAELWRRHRPRVPPWEWFRSVPLTTGRRPTSALEKLHPTLTPGNLRTAFLGKIDGVGPETRDELRDAMRSEGFLPEGTPLSNDEIREAVAARFPNEPHLDRLLGLLP